MKTVKYTSLDGRTQNGSRILPKPKPKSPKEAYLKPSTPPKQNPWARNTSLASNSQGFQKLPPLADETFPALPSQGNESSVDKIEVNITNGPSCSMPLLVSEEVKDEANEHIQKKESPSVSLPIDDSESRRRMLEAAAARASKFLWNCPFGADVYIRVEASVFQIHREILIKQSGWFRQHLPPPNLDGAPVKINLPYAAGAVYHCLKFIYTKKISICDRDLSWPLNIIHLPRCVLAYCAAVALSVPNMAAQLLRIVEETANDLSEFLANYFLDREIDRKTGRVFTLHLVNAFSIVHAEPSYELMKPMRQALAKVLDAILPCLLSQPVLIEMLRKPLWRQWSGAIAADQVEHRRAMGLSHPLKGSTLPDEDELGVMFDRLLKA